MNMRAFYAVVAGLMAAALSTPVANEPHTQPLFDLTGMSTGPFPTDWFTVADDGQLTGRRVRLPRPESCDADATRSDCQDLDTINTLDGFNIQPRTSIPFDAPIDPTTITSDTMFFVSLGDAVTGEGAGKRIGIDQVVWDPETNTVHVESHSLLDQHTRYALIVTRAVRDVSGAPIGVSDAFAQFSREFNFGQAKDPELKTYRKALLDGLAHAAMAGVPRRDVAVASVFTTQSITAVLEKIRDQIRAGIPAPATFLLGPGGSRTVFSMPSVTQLNFRPQVTVSPATFTSINFPLAPLRTPTGDVGQLAFGKYMASDYLAHPGEYIPQVGTLTGTPAVQGEHEVYFNLVLPSSPKPAGGWPVAIYGHGGSANKNGQMTLVAAKMAEHGIATVTINVVGHGGGPLSTVAVTAGGVATTFSAGGRGIDQDGDNVIGPQDGLFAGGAHEIIFSRDGYRQTAADLMQLVRVIQVGIDVDGDSIADIDPARISYFGMSQGGNVGTLFMAAELSVLVGVLNVPGSPLTDVDRLSPPRRSILGRRLAARLPSLLNAPGVTRFGGLPVEAPHFFDNLPLRGGVELAVTLADGSTQIIRSPVVNTAAGALEIQEQQDRREWAFQGGNPVAYARHLRRDPLPGVPAKAVLIQMAKGDMTLANPLTTAIVRAGDLADVTTFYRHDLAFAANSLLQKDPHTLLIVAGSSPLRPTALAAQEQIAVFFNSGGTVIMHPAPSDFFEVPIAGPLPEELSFIP
jgi:hypothetical protein